MRTITIGNNLLFAGIFHETKTSYSSSVSTETSTSFLRPNITTTSTVTIRGNAVLDAIATSEMQPTVLEEMLNSIPESTDGDETLLSSSPMETHISTSGGNKLRPFRLMKCWGMQWLFQLVFFPSHSVTVAQRSHAQPVCEISQGESESSLTFDHCVTAKKGLVEKVLVTTWVLATTRTVPVITYVYMSTITVSPNIVTTTTSQVVISTSNSGTDKWSEPPLTAASISQSTSLRGSKNHFSMQYLHATYWSYCFGFTFMFVAMLT